MASDWPLGGVRAGAAALFGLFAWGAEETHTVPYAPSASSEGRAGVVRIESRSARPGEVRVVAVDDAGRRVEAGLLTLGAGAAMEFETAAMESGDAAPGLAGTGPGQGDWRLELTTELDIEARAYARAEGFLTALHDAALVAGEVELPLFHPGGEARPRSVLRLANAGGERATVTVGGVDDAGHAGGEVTVELGAWESRGYTASELESGSAAGLSGSLGDGAGKWRLFLEAERGSAYATNLLLDGSVLSSVPGGMSRGVGGLHRVSLFPSASDGAGRHGVVRVVNRSAEPAEVGIDAFDATDRAYERLRLSLRGHSSEQFDSTDLEQGSSEKGLEGSTGSGEGDWWLELTSGSDIEVLSYVDTATGPLSALRGAAGVETDAGMRYEALLLSGAAGELRLLNAGGETVAVRVSGTDDAGASGGAAELTLAPWASRTLTREALEEGEAGLRGALGAGTGSWRLSVEADGEIDVLSLVRGAGGTLSDVSRRRRPAGAPPRTDVIDAAVSRADLRVAASASEAELSPGGGVRADGDGGQRRRSPGVGDDAALPPLGERDDRDRGHRGGDGCGGRACSGGRGRNVAGAERADGARHLPLRGVRGRGGGGDEHGGQLLGGGGGDGSGAAAAAGPGGDGFGERCGAGARGVVRPEGHGAQPGRRRGPCDDAALPPVFGRGDRDNGYAGGNGRGGSAGRLGFERGIDRADGADDGGRVLLRGVRGRGGGRIGHDEQLLGAGRGGRGGAGGPGPVPAPGSAPASGPAPGPGP